MQSNKRGAGLREVFNFIGGVSGLLSIVVLIWKGGALAQTVADHDRRISVFEVHGSVGLTEHVKYDDERVSNLKDRVTRVETALLNLAEMQKDIAVMAVQVGQIQKTVERVKP